MVISCYHGVTLCDTLIIQYTAQIIKENFVLYYACKATCGDKLFYFGKSYIDSHPEHLKIVCATF